jgi:hypothetical protein
VLLIRLIFLPVTLSLFALRLGFRIGRLFGFRRLLVFSVGVAVGLLAAPTTGEELRDRIRRELEARRTPGDAALTERLRAELAQSPRTWHLPQPAVEVVSGTAILRGSVPHDTARADLERAAMSVAGVVAVDNHLAVESPATV